MEKLSAKQQRIYDYIKSYIKKNNIPPTIREICQAAGLASTSTVHAHLATLERKGYIVRKKSKNRYMEIIENGFYEEKIVKIPIIDSSVGSSSVFSPRHTEGYFPVSSEIIGDNDCFMLKINDNSMEKAGIRKGDLVLVKKQSYAENDDIVIAVVEGKATCKRFFKENNLFRLQSESKDYPPVIVNDIMILGKVSGLFRLF